MSDSSAHPVLAPGALSSLGPHVLGFGSPRGAISLLKSPGNLEKEG